MAVGAKNPKIFYHIVLVVSVDVIQLQRERHTVPLWPNSTPLANLSTSFGNQFVVVVPKPGVTSWDNASVVLHPDPRLVRTNPRAEAARTLFPPELLSADFTVGDSNAWSLAVALLAAKLP